MEFRKPKETVFFSIERAIKSYRQFAQAKFQANGIDLTVDQWLILNLLEEDPEVSQADIVERLFKDSASVTRSIDLLIAKNLLEKKIFPKDRRRHLLRFTETGLSVMMQAKNVVLEYRKQALQSFTDEEIEHLQFLLEKLYEQTKK